MKGLNILRHKNYWIEKSHKIKINPFVLAVPFVIRKSDGFLLVILILQIKTDS